MIFCLDRELNTIKQKEYLKEIILKEKSEQYDREVVFWFPSWK